MMPTTEPIGPGRFANGGYQVNVREDGSILVKPGDWLSKYAVAMYNNPHQLGDFYWPPLSATGVLRPIQEHEKDHLELGDTVIHKPTWDKWLQGNPGRPPLGRPMTMSIDDFLQQLRESGVPGERINRMSSLLTGAKWRDISESDALKQLGVLALGVNSNWTMLNGPTPLPVKLLGPVAAETLAGALGFLAVFQFTFQSLVVWLDAQESGLRFAGLRAIAYATTAFAFGDPSPCLPYGIEYNLTHGTWRGVIPVSRYKASWLDVVSKTTARLVADMAARKVNRQVYQTWIRWEANDRRELAVKLMEEIARSMSKMLPVDRDLFMNPPPLYPSDWA
jgi:hypothetical protein